MAIAGAYYPNYFVQMEMDEQMATKDMCGLNPQTTVMVSAFEKNDRNTRKPIRTLTFIKYLAVLSQFEYFLSKSVK